MKQERIEAIDLARGLALLGVALVNIYAFAFDWESSYALNTAKSRADGIAILIQGLVFTHRCYPVLAFIFGYGIGLSFRRHVPILFPDHQRRMRKLIFIGTLFGLLFWPGEITTSYGLIGLGLTWYVRASPTRFMYFLLVLIAIKTSSFLISVYQLTMINSYSPQIENSAMYLNAINSFYVKQRLYEWLSMGLTQSLSPGTWLLVAGGIYIGKNWTIHDLFQLPKRKTIIWQWLQIIFCMCTLGMAFCAHKGGWNNTTQGMWTEVNSILEDILGLIAVPIFLVYAYRWSKSKVCSWFKGHCQNAGTAPLTQFIGQGIIFTVIFSHLYFAQAGKHGRFIVSCIAFATWLGINYFIRYLERKGYERAPADALWRYLARR